MPSRSGALDRALGRRDLTLFAINRVIGAGIFGIPAVLYASVGVFSVAAFLLAALAVSLITLCFAEVGSAYRDTGGPYLYAYRTFGPLVGFEVGWLMWVTQLGGFAAVINLFVNYVGWFMPGATSGLPRAAIVTTVAALLTVVNVLGVRRAATINNILTLAKLLPLALFVIVGALYIDVRPLRRCSATHRRRSVGCGARRGVRLQRLRGAGCAEWRDRQPVANDPLRAARRAPCRGDHLCRRSGRGHRDTCRAWPSRRDRSPTRRNRCSGARGRR